MRYADTAVGGVEESLEAWLRPRLGTAELVALRTGFLTLPGLQVLQPALEDLLDRGGQFELVTGGTGEQADPTALSGLLQLSRRHDGLGVWVVADGGVFHNAKTVYVRHEDGRAEARVGSANLTRGGLATNHEAALAVDSTVDDPAVVEEVLAGVRVYQDLRFGARALDGAVIADLQVQMPSVNGRGRGVEQSEPLERLLQPTMDEIDAVASQGGHRAGGVLTGFEDLDALTGGLYPGSVTVVASRPSVGRSTLALDMCRNTAIKHQVATGFVTAAVSKSEVVHQVLAAEARIRLGDMRTGRMNDQDWTRLARRMSEVSDAPLHITACSAPGIDELVAEMTRLRVDEDAHLVVVDPLSAITAITEPGASREREVAMIMRRLKAAALDLQLALVVTAELGRGNEQRPGSKPQVRDLRESDTIAQVADNVILLYRPDAFEREDPRMGEADLILAKHRAGPAATVTVAHQLHYCRFVDMAPD